MTTSPASRSGSGLHFRGRGLACACVLLAFGISAAQAQSFVTGPSGLDGTNTDFKFERYLADLDLEDSQQHRFHYKTGGTSIGFKISSNGRRKKGLFLPTNGATDLEGEVVAYRLSRLLGVSQFYNPVDYYKLGPIATRRFKAMLPYRESGKWRRYNHWKLRKKLANNPNSLFGIVKFRHKRRSQPVNQLVNGTGGLKRSHILARYLQASGPQPPTRQLRLARVGPDKKKYPYPSEQASELTRQLSIIFVIDMLTEQWDRFSGGNVEAYALKTGTLQFVARDNGGASLSNNRIWYKRFLAWTSRYDRDFINKLTALNDFLQGRSDHYDDITDLAKMKFLMGFRSDRKYKAFVAKLRRFAQDDLPALQRRYGSNVYFAPVEQLVADAGAAASGSLHTATGIATQASAVWTDVVIKRPKRLKKRNVSPHRSARSQRKSWRRLARHRKRKSNIGWWENIFTKH